MTYSLTSSFTAQIYCHFLWTEGFNSGIIFVWYNVPRIFMLKYLLAELITAFIQGQFATVKKKSNVTS